MEKGQVMSPEQKMNISLALKKKFAESPEILAKMVETRRVKCIQPPMLGKHHTAETKAKMSLAHRRENLSPETRAKLSEAGKNNPGMRGMKHSPETKAKLSAIGKARGMSAEDRARVAALGRLQKGKPKSAETKAKISQAKKGTKLSPESIAKRTATRKERGIRSAMLGKKHMPETLAKMSESSKDFWANPENRTRMMAVRKVQTTAETRAKLSVTGQGNKSRTGQHLSEEEKRKHSLAAKGKPHKPEHRAHLLASWARPEIRDKAIRNSLRAQNRKQTKPEKILETILGEILPNEYKYVGSSGDVMIAGVPPDFINVNGKKKIIECFGDWWHGKKKTGKTKEEVETERIERFKEYGFGCLILWENEIKNENKRADIIERIIAFNSGEPLKPTLQMSLW